MARTSRPALAALLAAAAAGHASDCTQARSSWTPPAAADYARVRDTVLMPQGLSEAQVQAAWVKEADISPTIALPNSAADAYALQTALGQIVRAMKVRYPNLK